MKHLLTVLALVASHCALAGVESITVQADAAKSVAPAGRVEVAAPERPKLTDTATKKTPPGLTLRCWQFGRLILEEPVSALPAVAASQPVTLESRLSSTPIQLIDAQAAFCVVK